MLMLRSFNICTQFQYCFLARNTNFNLVQFLIYVPGVSLSLKLVHAQTDCQIRSTAEQTNASGKNHSIPSMSAQCQKYQRVRCQFHTERAVMII